MSRRADELVAEIRTRRRRVARDLRELQSVREIERRVRRSPGPWIAGSVLAGLVAARFMAEPLVQRGRRGLRAFAVRQLRSMLVAAGVAAASKVASGPDDGGAPSGAASGRDGGGAPAQRGEPSRARPSSGR